LERNPVHGIAFQTTATLERLKTLEPGDKKASVTLLLNKAAAEPSFRARLETEARKLTEIGDKFMIRHTEIDKVPIELSGHIDYLFLRMFAPSRALIGIAEYT
jgi:hypothetical protein